jgi:VEFS-Box of polycomb protein
LKLIAKLHIAVTSKSTTAAIDAEYVPKGYKVKDFVMCRRRIATTSGRCIPTVPTLKRQLPSLSGRRKKPKTDNNIQTSLPENTSDQYPIRQYYHSRSYEPMMLGEWDFDSDDQEDDDWLTRIGDEVCEVTNEDLCLQCLYLLLLILKLFLHNY